MLGALVDFQMFVYSGFIITITNIDSPEYTIIFKINYKRCVCSIK